MKTNWTRCSDKLPTKPGEYLVVINSFEGFKYTKLVDYMFHMRVQGTGGLLEECKPGWYEPEGIGYREVDNVTHWMELPDMPEK